MIHIHFLTLPKPTLLHNRDTPAYTVSPSILLLNWQLTAASLHAPAPGPFTIFTDSQHSRRFSVAAFSVAAWSVARTMKQSSSSQETVSGLGLRPPSAWPPPVGRLCVAPTFLMPDIWLQQVREDTSGQELSFISKWLPISLIYFSLWMFNVQPAEVWNAV